MTPLSEDILEFFLVWGAYAVGLSCLFLVGWGVVSVVTWLIGVIF